MEEILLNNTLSDSRDPGKPAPGALLRADNAMFVRPGIVDMRPCFAKDAEFDATVASRQPRALIDYNKGPNSAGMLVSYSNTSNFLNHNAIWADGTAMSVASWPFNNVFPPMIEYADMVGATMRSNLYVPTLLGGMGKFTSPGGGILPVNHPTPGPSFSSGNVTINISADADDNWLPAGDSVAYHFLYVTRDINGVVVRSSPTLAPSGAENLLGVAGHPRISVDVSLSEFAVVGEAALEIYRTRSGALITAGNYAELGSFYLLASVPIAAGSLSFTFNDVYPDDFLGAELYTGPGQEGAEAGNWVPPRGTTIDSFRDCMWVGNIEQLPLITTRIQPRVTGSSYRTAGVDSVGMSMTFASGSGNVTVASTALLRPGMYLGETANSPGQAGARIAANTRIVSITNATTFVISPVATGTGVVATARASDFFEISYNGTSHRIFAAPALTSGGTAAYFELGVTPLTQARAFASAFHANFAASGVMDSAFVWDGDSSTTGAVVIFVQRNSWGPQGTGFTFSTSAPGGFPDLAFTDLQTPIYVGLSYSHWMPNAVAHSKPYEPEHWPLGNTIFIGNYTSKVLAIKSLRDAKIVFKEDGIWRITGSAPNNWSVDELDTETRLVKPEAVCELDNVLYALTNRGIVAVTEYDVQVISQPILAPDGGQQSREDDPLYAARKFTPSNANDGSKGCYAVAMPHRGLVAFAIPRSLLQSQADFWWVYNPSLNAWSRFMLTSRCAAFSTSKQKLVIDAGSRSRSTFELRLEKYALDDTDYSDNFTAFTTPLMSNTNLLTLSYATVGNAKPSSGDILSFPSGSAFVLSSADTGSGYSIVLDRNITSASGSGGLLEGVVTDLQWAAVSPANPFNIAQWAEANVAFFQQSSGAVLPGKLSLAFSPSPGFGESASDITLNDSSLGMGTMRTYRAGVPRTVARASTLSLRAFITVASQQWRLGQAMLNLRNQTGQGRTFKR